MSLPGRVAVYLAVGLGLTLVYGLLRGSTWQGDADLHSHMAVVVTMLALMVGVMALVHFYAKKDNTYLFFGTGFLGAAFLDGYHAVVTSHYFEAYLPPDSSLLIPWSWDASRFFLAAIMYLSYLAWTRERRLGDRGRIGEGTVYLFGGALALASFLFFAFVPLPRVYYPEIWLHRPEELIPALFFLLALVGYLRKGQWRHDAFEHWLVLSLIVGLVGQAVFMSNSGQLFDFEFDAAHILKMVGYICVLTGLLIDTSRTFRQAEASKLELAETNARLKDDIAERERMDAALRDSEARASAVVDTAVDAILVIGQWGKVEAFNPAGEELFGYRAEEVIGQNVSMLMPAPQREEHDDYLQNYLDTAEAKVIGIGREVTGLHKDGSEIPLELSVSEVWLDQGPVFVGMLRDITERKDFERELESLALYDVLTGLANRSLFQARLRDALANAKRSGQMVAIMLLDLDHFKDVNDSLGHPAGDALLKEVAARLESNVRETDTVARLGGDEFAIIATNIDNLEGVSVVAKKLVDAIAVPFGFEHHEIRTGTSVGISVCPPDEGDSDQLLKHADFALYQAKSAGRGTWQFYDAEMNAKRQARKVLEDHLAHALERDEFTLFYQPKIDARSGEVTGVEALIRWMHPERGMVPPLEFIPIAEESGQIVEIGAWVVRTACAQHLAWRELGLPPIPVAINLSSVQFKDGNLPLSLRAIVAEFGLNPAFIELEITESVIVENTESVSEQFRMLRKLGHSIAIDDFGTGYSSLAYLRQFPVDKLKIDRAFVANITDDPGDAALVKGIIALAKSLGMGTVAEGVETEAQLTLLRRHGCEEIQGYYFSPPIAAEAFVAWYRSRAKEAKGEAASLMAS